MGICFSGRCYRNDTRSRGFCSTLLTLIGKVFKTHQIIFKISVFRSWPILQIHPYEFHEYPLNFYIRSGCDSADSQETRPSLPCGVDAFSIYTRCTVKLRSLKLCFYLVVHLSCAIFSKLRFLVLYT